MDKATTNKEHSMTCLDCHKYMSEMMNIDRENIRKDFRAVIREELQIKIETLQDVKKLKGQMFRVTISDVLQWGTIGYIIIKSILL